jgi:integrase
MAANQDEMDILIALNHTAARIDEIRRLIWDDVNFEKKELTLKTRKRRGGTLQSNKLPMSETLYKVLWRKWETRDKELPWVFVNKNTGKQYTKNTHTTRYLMRRLCTKAGVKQFRYHSIRHHVAAILSDSKKASLFEIQYWLRHKKATTTQIYLKTIGPDLIGCANIIETKSTCDGEKNTPESRQETNV